MVLEHDPRSLDTVYITSATDRQHHLQCRHARQALVNKLREFADFELLENSHFIKFIKRCRALYIS